jgi:hypothetical protein
MYRSKRTTLGVIALLVACVAGSVLWFTESAGANRTPFAPLVTKANVSALSGAPVTTLPPEVRALPLDSVPTTAAVYPIGQAAYGWMKGDSVCMILMHHGPAGCFATFYRPVEVAYWGSTDQDAYYVGGLAPDSVRSVTVTTMNGSLDVPVEANGFITSVPYSTVVTGITANMTDGSQVQVDSKLDPNDISHPPLS